MRLFAILVSALAHWLASPALASAEETDRYRLEKIGHRLCQDGHGHRRDVDLRGAQRPACLQACRRRARRLPEDIDRLQAKLDDVEGRVAKLEARPSIPETLLPSDEQVDKGIDIMEKFFR